MKNPLAPEDVSLDALVALLDAAAIDHDEPGEDTVYVTGYAFNLWIRVEADTASITIYTFWDIAGEVDELAMLRFANHLNLSWRMIQFAYDEGAGRLWGYYLLSFRDGLFPAQILRAASRFAGIFQKAVVEGVDHGLLEALSHEEPGVAKSIN